MKLAICVPTQDFTPTTFWLDIIHLILYLSNDKVNFSFNFNQGSFPIDWKRNAIVKKAMEGNPDYILFVDADMHFTPEDVYQLIKGTNKIVTGFITKKVVPFTPCVFQKEKDEKFHWVRFSEEERGMVELDGAGLAFVMIPAEVFKKVPFPWFQCEMNYDKENESVGEDFYFFKKVKKYAPEFKIYCNFSAKIRHIGGDGVGFENSFYYAYPQKEVQVDVGKLFKVEPGVRHKEERRVY